MKTTTFVARRTVLAIGAGALISAVIGRTFAAEKWKWERFGVAPFAGSREEAMAQLEVVLKKLGFPAPVIALFAGETKKPGERAELKNGDEFVAQIGAGGVVHGLEEGGGIVAFTKPARGMRFVADAEKWAVTWEGKVYTLILPEVCYNFTRGLEVQAGRASVVALPAPQFQRAALPPTCPEVYTLKVNFWPFEAASFPGVAATLAKEDLRQGEFSKAEHFSRKHGAQMRQALAEGKLARSTTEHQLQISLIKTAESRGGESTIDAEEVLGGVTVNGLLELTFTRAQIEGWDAIRLVSVDDVRSPPQHPKTGRKEVRFFNHTVRVPKGGEWDLSDCISNVHFIEKQLAKAATVK